MGQSCGIDGLASGQELLFLLEVRLKECLRLVAQAIVVTFIAQHGGEFGMCSKTVLPFFCEERQQLFMVAFGSRGLRGCLQFGKRAHTNCGDKTDNRQSADQHKPSSRLWISRRAARRLSYLPSNKLRTARE